jgi:hypothetical protein
MIQIDNLTEKQVQMLDEMWELYSYEEYEEYLNNLSAEDRKMAEALSQMVILAEMDELVGNCKEANDVLKKFAL